MGSVPPFSPAAQSCRKRTSPPAQNARLSLPRSTTILTSESLVFQSATSGANVSTIRALIAFSASGRCRSTMRMPGAAAISKPFASDGAVLTLETESMFGTTDARDRRLIVEPRLKYGRSMVTCCIVRLPSPRRAARLSCPFLTPPLHVASAHIEGCRCQPAL